PAEEGRARALPRKREPAEGKGDVRPGKAGREVAEREDRNDQRQRQAGAFTEKGQRGGERREAERPAGGVERQRRGPGAGDETRRRGGGKAPGCGGRELRHAALALLAPVPRRPQRGCESCSRRPSCR